MPGLNQLKQFNNDILSLGDEITLRASRGEKPVRVPLPKGVPEKDDSEDFVLGMPEIAAIEESSPVDEDLSDITGISSSNKKDSGEKEADSPSFEAPDLSALLNPIATEDNSVDMGMPDLSQFMDEPEEEEFVQEEIEPEEISVADMGLDALLSGSGFDGSEGTGVEEKQEETEPENYFYDDINTTPSKDEISDIEEIQELDNVSDGLEEPLDEPMEDIGPATTSGDALSLDEIMGTGTPDLENKVPEIEDAPSVEDFDLPESADSFEMDAPSEAFDFDAPENLDEPADLNEPADFDVPVAFEETDSPEAPDADFDSPEAPADLPEEEKFEAAEVSDLSEDSSGLDDALPGLDDFASDVNAEMPDFKEEIEAAGDMDFSGDEADFGLEDADSNEPVEIFDTTGMDEDIDFGIPDTDAQLNGDGDFQMGNADDFAMEGSDFEIPGFSDVSTINEKTAKAASQSAAEKAKHLDVPDFSGAKEGDSIPENALSDEQYKTFLKNLGEYPLNVRLAFENLIVQDEFTDDAEFEIIQKILNKAPSRQVAASLEKMLDISISVPRDFEHRTAEEYEAYKKSISYQLRNRILPGILCAMILLVAGWGLFNFGKYCVVWPLKANSLYKQGYALLEADEYPQSEDYFERAAKYKMKRKWFFTYARGYRDKKQYQRAERMYKYILRYFNHDKEGGLEYADMELNYLANYEKAEEVLRREVLDYHINDKDGILMLGDVFLEWGTEKDPSKFADAKEQYNTYYQYFGSSNTINSRFMKYFIRTDNLENVLGYKEMFEPKEKSLSSDDWTELSGYLLEKLYGDLSPSEEYLRERIEGVRKLLQRAVITNPENPIALYNLGKYYVYTNETVRVESTLNAAIEKFNNATHIKPKDLYKFIDSYRLLGENYIKTLDYLRAQEQFTNGITLYTKEKENAGFKGNEQIGHLYADLGDINYFVAADYDNAEKNYNAAIELNYDNSKIRYRMGYIDYKDKDYLSALASFIKAGEGIKQEENLLLAMGNTLTLRNDDMAAEGYYSQLLEKLNASIAKDAGSLLPQSNSKDNELITKYLYATNNAGVNLYKVAKRTGDSNLNAQAIVQLQESLRAWDALTRNQVSMVRLGGSNLAEENIKYITHSITEFEPSIYLDIPKTLYVDEEF